MPKTSHSQFLKSLKSYKIFVPPFVRKDFSRVALHGQRRIILPNLITSIARLMSLKFSWKYKIIKQILLTYFSVSQTITSNQANAQMYSGPLELLIDVPFELGCFELLDASILASPEPSVVTPASCLVACIDGDQRFAGSGTNKVYCSQWPF